MLKTISRAVWILSLVSLLTDVASEMLYPGAYRTLFFLALVPGLLGVLTTLP